LGNGDIPWRPGKFFCPRFRTPRITLLPRPQQQTKKKGPFALTSAPFLIASGWSPPPLFGPIDPPGRPLVVDGWDAKRNAAPLWRRGPGPPPSSRPRTRVGREQQAPREFQARTFFSPRKTLTLAPTGFPPRSNISAGPPRGTGKQPFTHRFSDNNFFFFSANRISRSARGPPPPFFSFFMKAPYVGGVGFWPLGGAPPFFSFPQGPPGSRRSPPLPAPEGVPRPARGGHFFREEGSAVFPVPGPGFPGSSGLGPCPPGRIAVFVLPKKKRP